MRELQSRFMEKTKYLRSMGGVFFANVFNNLTSFLITILAARMLGPEEFGILAVTITITVLFSILIDFGLNITLVRLYNGRQAEGSEILPAIIQWKMLLVAVALPGGVVLRELVLAALPIMHGHGTLVYFSFLSGALLSFWSTMRAVEQALRDFRQFSRNTAAYGLFRLFCAAGLLLYGKFTALGVLLALYFFPLTALILFGWATRYKVFWASMRELPCRTKYAYLRKAFSYSVWVAAAGISYTLLSRVPQFFLGRGGREAEVGLYSAGLTFVMIFSLLNEAARTVLLPDVAALQTEDARLQFRVKLLRGIPIYFVIGGLALCGMALFQIFVLREAYSASVHVFLILGASTMTTMFIGFFNILVHSYGIPGLEAAVNIGRVAALILLLWPIPRNAVSAALAFAFILVLSELLLYSLVKRHGEKSESIRNIS